MLLSSTASLSRPQPHFITTSKTSLKGLSGRFGYAKTAKKTTPEEWPTQRGEKASVRRPSDSLGKWWPKTIRRWHLKPNQSPATTYQYFKKKKGSWQKEKYVSVCGCVVNLSLAVKSEEKGPCAKRRNGGKLLPSCLTVLTRTLENEITGPSLLERFLALSKRTGS